MPFRIKIPRSTIDRLPLYYRCLNLIEEHGIEEISSQVLGVRVGVDPSVIRKDLAWFGELGKRGVGYNVTYLKEAIARILGLDKEWPFILVGAGKLGMALAEHNRKYGRHFNLVGVFDRDPEKIGKKVGGRQVSPMEDMPGVIKEYGIKIAMLAVPAEEAQKVAHELVKCGIKGILSYAPITLSVPEDVLVYNADYNLDLQRLAYYIKNDGNISWGE
ncbi:MAG: redox-sensing transcriptional repressor [Moorella sp. (in: firmicutes)]|jgi:redox-sensing transcriptional repressor|uniref:redox-sensing transcriptional repressor Rex n=1 Tax=unclassified Neomoorella TaxID=2676739 RepID=UPI0010FFBBF4|nr:MULTISPECIES: redox-sensing transcriptional repressor Rex [unclassified Moorella (in: firmicutes)]MDK2816911.1 redox-sensing transcriptional repressor [Moorella sp. (in: firmicutes)]GEA16070.1 redox-sensing transcriptional repressor Rex [Moorella sp. E308F]GEA19087.1 redox-sensing transcriptional repressor Rex [Moorella sp. E306M]